LTPRGVKPMVAADGQFRSWCDDYGSSVVELRHEILHWVLDENATG
jgi:hypothetical protein